MNVVRKASGRGWAAVWVASVACAVACDTSPRAREPSANKPAKSEAAAPATPAPAAEPDDGLRAIDGAALLRRMRESGDKATLVSVWASWCGSCKRELPMIAGMAPALRNERVGLVFVSADNPGDRPAAAKMWRELVPSLPGFIVGGPLGPFKRALNPAWKGSLPSTFLFDDKAALRYFWPGPVFDYEIEPVVSAFLAGQPLEGQGPALIERDAPPP